MERTAKEYRNLAKRSRDAASHQTNETDKRGIGELAAIWERLAAVAKRQESQASR